jgi:hypothetical protein
MTEVARIFGAAYFNGKSYAFILTENMFGYILGDLFKNSSCHPADKIQFWVVH